MKLKTSLLIISCFFILTTNSNSQTIEIIDSCWIRNGPYCAFVNSLAMAPSNSDVLYLGTYSAGVYKTINGGETWTFCSKDNLPMYEDSSASSATLPSWWFGDYYPVNVISVDPQNENHLWIGTTDKGLFESIDGGNNWQKAKTNIPDSITINVININKQNTDDILVGTDRGDNSGVFRTLNGGLSWFLMNDLPHDQSYFITDIKRDIQNNDHIIIAISSMGVASFPWGIVESYDNGATWDTITDRHTFFDLNINPENSQEIWAVGYTGFLQAILEYSIDGGKNWNWYMDFEDPNKEIFSMYADADYNFYIERDAFEEFGGYSILKKNNNDTTWFEVDNLSNKDSGYFPVISLRNKCQADQNNTNNIFFGTYYGVYYSSDGGITTNHKNTGLMNSYLQDVEINTAKRNILYTAGDQGLWKSIDGGITWKNITNEELNFVKCDPQYPDTTYFGGKGLYRSYDGCETYKNIVSPYFNSLEDMAINPVNTNILYYLKISGGGESYTLCKSVDYGTTWNAVLSIDPNSVYKEIIIDPNHPDTIYVGEHRSIDGGQTWEQAFSKLITGIHPDSSNQLYATSSRLQTDLLVSYNMCENWKKIAEGFNGPFAGENIHCLRFGEDNHDYIFFSTRNSNVYYSSDAGENWQQLPGSYNPRVTDIIPLVEENKYYLSTHGGGVWVYDTSLLNSAIDPKYDHSTVKMIASPNPFVSQTNICFSLFEKSFVKLSVYNIQGKEIKSLVKSNLPGGKHQIVWDGTNNKNTEVQSGLYYIRLNIKENANTCKVIKIN